MRYTLTNISDSEKRDLEGMTLKPFLIEVEGNVFFAKLAEGLKFEATGDGRWNCDVEVEEVLG